MREVLDTRGKQSEIYLAGVDQLHTTEYVTEITELGDHEIRPGLPTAVSARNRA